MEKKNVTEVIKELIPVAVDIISDKLSKEDNNDNATVGLVIDNNGDVHNIESKELNDTVNDVHELAVGLIKYKPINKITESMNERGLSDEEKVRESYANGFCDGFMLANFAQQHHIDHTYEKLSDINETIETAKYLIEQKFE